MSLLGKVAVVTGAATGIGRASALRLAQDKADVAIIDINMEGMEETAELVRATGQECIIVHADLLDRSSIKDAFNKVKADMGFIEILHNNAGGSSRTDRRSFVDAPAEKWDYVLDLNLRVTADCTREVVGEMRERRAGRIISTSSEMAFKGGPFYTDYAAAKAGILGFTRSLALDLAESQVTVNAICPGIIQTPVLEFLTQEHIQRGVEQCPMKRMGTPEEVAHAVSFFASPGASYVTGTYLLVAGGRTLH